jgi:hypothetical protein
VVLLVVGGVVVLALGGAAAVYLFREGAEPVSIPEAEKRFNEDRTAGPQPGSVLVPAEGVYSYEGSGTDRLSVPPASQDQGPAMPGTVTHGKDGCWTFRIDYSTKHWQSWRYCSTDGRLEEQGGQTFQRWDLGFTTIDTTTTFECDPPVVTLRPAMEPDQSWRQSCSGTSTSIDGRTTSAGPMRFVGTERLTIGDKQVDAYHFRQRRNLEGAQTGSVQSEIWFGTDGLPLRNERHTEVHSDSVVGDVVYTEDGTFTLTSLRPSS